MAYRVFTDGALLLETSSLDKAEKEYAKCVELLHKGKIESVELKYPEHKKEST